MRRWIKTYYNGPAHRAAVAEVEAQKAAARYRKVCENALLAYRMSH